MYFGLFNTFCKYYKNQPLTILIGYLESSHFVPEPHQALNALGLHDKAMEDYREYCKYIYVTIIDILKGGKEQGLVNGKFGNVILSSSQTFFYI